MGTLPHYIVTILQRICTTSLQYYEEDMHHIAIIPQWGYAHLQLSPLICKYQLLLRRNLARAQDGKNDICFLDGERPAIE